MTGTAAIAFVPFEPAHLAALELQPAQAPFASRLRAAANGMRAAAVPGLAWSGVIGATVVGCAGILPVEPHRGIAWAWLGRMPRACWPRVVRMMARVLAAAHRRGLHRIEATVACGFGQGCRLARILGFEVEGVMRAWGADRTDHFLYARIES